MFSVILMEKIKPERIPDYGNAGQRHGHGRKDRVHLKAQKAVKAAGSQRNAQSIVNKGPEKIFPDVFKHGPAELYGGDQIIKT